MAIGWIMLNRKIQDHWLWEEKPFSKAQAWIDLLLSVNHEDKKFSFGDEVIEVKRGSFITSELKLMERWGWSKSKVRTFLKLLENDLMIVKKSDHKKTTIIIVNYDSYQEIKTTKRPQKDHRETNGRLQKDTNNNDNNDNNENKKDFTPPANNSKAKAKPEHSQIKNKLPDGVKIEADGTVSYADVDIWGDE